MSRKVHLLAAFFLLILALVSSSFAGTPLQTSVPGIGGTPAPVPVVRCPLISPRCCATDTNPTTGCPFCVCYFPSDCC